MVKTRRRLLALLLISAVAIAVAIVDPGAALDTLGVLKFSKLQPPTRPSSGPISGGRPMGCAYPTGLPRAK